MSTLLARVRAITGSTDTYSTDTQVVDFLKSSCDFVINQIPKKLLWPVASNSDSIIDGNGFVCASDTIIDARRNGIPCEELDNKYAYAHESALTVDSIFERTVIFPGYILRNGRVFIKPDPTDSAVGIVTYVAFPTIADDTEDTWTFRIFNNLIFQYAAGFDYLAVGSYWRKIGETELNSIVSDVSASLINFAGAIPTWSAVTMDAIPAVPTVTISYTGPSGYSLPESITLVTSLPSTISLNSTLPADMSLTTNLPDSFSISATLPTYSPQSLSLSYTDITDALTKALSFIDNASGLGSSAQTAEQYLAPSSEDAEMVNAIVNTASQEVNRANSSIQKEIVKIQEYSNGIQQALGQFNGDVSKYQSETQKEVSGISSQMEIYRGEVEREARRIEASLNKYQSELAKEAKRIESDTTIYRVELEKEVADVNASIESYKAEQQDSISTMQAAINDAQLQIQLWSERVNEVINKYQADVNGEAKRFEDALAKARIYLEEAQIRTGSVNNVQTYLNNAIELGNQSKISFEKAYKEVENYINNNQRTINFKAKLERPSAGEYK